MDTNGALEKAKAKQEKAEAELAAARAAMEWKKLLATQELEILKAQSSLIGQLIPKGEAKGLEGKVEAEKLDHAVQQVAYENLKSIADDIARNLNKALPNDATLLVVSQLDFASGELPGLDIRLQLDSFNTQFTEQIERNNQLIEELGRPRVSTIATLLGALPLALSVVSTLADIASYFRTDYSITGYQFDLNKEAFVAALVSTLIPTLNGRTIRILNFHGMTEEPAILKEFAAPKARR